MLNLGPQFETIALASPIATTPPLCSPQTGVLAVDHYFQRLNLNSCVVEWGAAPGRLGRILPALFLKKRNHPCLWISNHQEGVFYSKFYESLGLNMDDLFFIKTPDALKTLRVALLENVFKTIVFDSSEFISKADQNFLSHQARLNRATYFALRPFFLTNRNGNPFCKYRINSSYNLKNERFSVHCIKGLHGAKRIQVKKREILGS